MRLDVLWLACCVAFALVGCSEQAQDEVLREVSRALVELVMVLIMCLREWQWSRVVQRENERLRGQVETLSLPPPRRVGGLGAEPPVLARLSADEELTAGPGKREGEQGESPPTPQPKRRPRAGY